VCSVVFWCDLASALICCVYCCPGWGSPRATAGCCNTQTYCVRPCLLCLHCLPVLCAVCRCRHLLLSLVLPVLSMCAVCVYLLCTVATTLCQPACTSSTPYRFAHCSVRIAASMRAAACVLFAVTALLRNRFYGCPTPPRHSYFSPAHPRQPWGRYHAEDSTALSFALGERPQTCPRPVRSPSEAQARFSSFPLSLLHPAGFHVLWQLTTCVTGTTQNSCTCLAPPATHQQQQYHMGYSRFCLATLAWLCKQQCATTSPLALSVGAAGDWLCVSASELCVVCGHACSDTGLPGSVVTGLCLFS